jgi:hypothetical protein
MVTPKVGGLRAGNATRLFLSRDAKHRVSKDGPEAGGVCALLERPSRRVASGDAPQDEGGRSCDV